MLRVARPRRGVAASDGVRSIPDLGTVRASRLRLIINARIVYPPRTPHCGLSRVVRSARATFVLRFVRPDVKPSPSHTRSEYACAKISGDGILVPSVIAKFAAGVGGATHSQHTARAPHATSGRVQWPCHARVPTGVLSSLENISLRFPSDAPGRMLLSLTRIAFGGDDASQAYFFAAQSRVILEIAAIQPVLSE